MIYFLQAIEGGPVKIGTTIRLSARLKALCQETGLELRVLAVTDGDLSIERELHRKFAHLRINEHFLSEWFEPGDDLLGFIIKQAKPWDGSDEVPLALNSLALQVRGSDEWKVWVEELADFLRTDVAKTVDAALIEFAKSRGFEKLPPKR